jgi:hypothetical protein
VLCVLRWQGWFNWLKYFFAPDNPFLSWMLVLDLLAIAAHLFMVYWVYKDALKRYHRGAPWGVLAALLPVAGWLLYLLYRSSPLVDFDRIEFQTFDETDQEWTDYDTYKANRHAAMFASLKSSLRREEGSGYSEWIKQSRAREIKRKLTPAELAQRKAERRQTRAERKQQKLERRQQALALRQQRRQAQRERQSMTGAHGFTFKLSDRKQRSLQRKMAVVEQLKHLPREDQALEELIYDMRYTEALQAAQDGLAVAQEMRDPQGVVTYETYVSRLLELIARASGEPD